MQSDIRELGTLALLKMHELDEADLTRVRALGRFIIPKLDKYGDLFYAWLVDIPEYHVLFTSPEILAHARSEQIRYWQRFFECHVDDAYVEARRHIGRTHARIGLSLPSYMAAMNYSFAVLTKTLYDNELSDSEYVPSLLSVTKLMHLDVTVVSDTYSRMVNEQIAQQSKAIVQMSTPVTQIWEDILVLPMVGIIDSRRAQDVMTTVLSRIFETRAKVFIMDISGVAVVDSAVANHLIKITKSTGLMGCTSLVSGISPAIAQTMVNLGFDVKEISTSATLRDALEQAFRLIGRTVT
ncbi:MAG TPA: protoglobin domain-containing protein [Burkholderiaceae bacterium]